MKKFFLLFILICGLTSCSNDSDKDSSAVEEIPTPTQSKYKAYYGEKLIKSSNTNRSANSETTKSFSVIIYPLTKTILFSNIFDTKTVEYPITNIEILESSRVYSFKINDFVCKCTVAEKIGDKVANVMITSEKENYSFDTSEIEKKNISKLLVKVSGLSGVKEYFYSDTLLIRTYSKGKNVINKKLEYEGSKLKTVSYLNNDNVVLQMDEFTYENDLIVKEINISSRTIVGTTLYKYDNKKRVSLVSNYDSTRNLISTASYSYEKNKVTTTFVYTNQSAPEIQVSFYDENAKPLIVSQDVLLNPLSYLPITSGTYTGNDGTVNPLPESFYEYAPDGLLLKYGYSNLAWTYEYREE